MGTKVLQVVHVVKGDCAAMPLPLHPPTRPYWYGLNQRMHNGVEAFLHSQPTLDSGINVPPGIIVAPPLKKFYTTILILFHINLGIGVIFKFFFVFKNFQKLISVPLCLFRSLE